jgi:dimethylamine/trimethylamine dehydrogenase
MRCTQNPTVGEEWRRGWHPERIATKSSEAKILIVGGGPAGMECARALGARGYQVALAEAENKLGGRVTREAALPGLAEWNRVRDWRIVQLRQMPNVETYPASRLAAADILDFGFERVAIATGATWRKDGRGRSSYLGIAGADQDYVVTPDDIMNGAEPQGPVLVFDDDHYVMGSLMAEHLRALGREVTLVTTLTMVSEYSMRALDQKRIQARVMQAGADVVTAHRLVRIGAGSAEIASIYTGEHRSVPCAGVVMVTSREPQDRLYRDLVADPDRLKASGIVAIDRIGDCWAPGTIAAAVHGGHLYAREFDLAEPVEPLRERVVI